MSDRGLAVALAYRHLARVALAVGNADAEFFLSRVMATHAQMAALMANNNPTGTDTHMGTLDATHEHQSHREPPEGPALP